MFGLVFLVKDIYKKRFQISWQWVGVTFISVIFFFVTYIINVIPIQSSWYLANTSWTTFWLHYISENITKMGILCVLIITPICCIYFVNPLVKSLFSKKSKAIFCKDALISCMVTIGASLLYYPIKYILYDYFPYYIDLSILNSRIPEFSGGFCQF